MNEFPYNFYWCTFHSFIVESVLACFCFFSSISRSVRGIRRSTGVRRFSKSVARCVMPSTVSLSVVLPHSRLPPADGLGRMGILFSPSNCQYPLPSLPLAGSVGSVLRSLRRMHLAEGPLCQALEAQIQRCSNFISCTLKRWFMLRGQTLPTAPSAVRAPIQAVLHV